MAKHTRERIWQPDAEETAAGLKCAVCGKAAVLGDTFAECPRCKARHHKACWVEKGGCSTLGCKQLADPELQEGRPRHIDPPSKDNMRIPIAFTIAALLLVAGLVLWGVFGPDDDSFADNLIVLLPVGFGAEGVEVVTIEAHTKDFAAAREDVADAAIITAPYGEMYDQKLVLLIMGKEPPDLVLVDRKRFASLVANNGLLPLDDIRSELAKNVPNLGEGVVDKILYGVPYRIGWIFAISSASNHPDAARDLLLYLAKKKALAE